jgi:hypothetical protein
MALPKDANAVIHRSFWKIQTATLHEMDPTRLVVRHNRPMTDKCNRMKALVDCELHPVSQLV